MADRVTVRQLAKLVGASHATIAKRVVDLVAAGKLTVEPGPNRSKLVDPDEYSRATEATIDGTKQHAQQAHRAATKADNGKVTPIDPHLAEMHDLRREQEQLRGELLELQVALRTGNACTSADFFAVITKIAGALANECDALFSPSSLTDLVEAQRREGGVGVRRWLETRLVEIAAKADTIAEREIDKLFQPASLQ